MASKIGVLTNSENRYDILQDFLEKKGFSSQKIKPQALDDYDLLIADTDAITSKVIHIIRTIKNPILFVSFSGSEKKISEEIFDSLFKTDFVEIDIKGGKIHPEFILHFKIGVLLKLRKSTAKIWKDGKKTSTKTVLKNEPPLMKNPHKKTDGRASVIVIGSSAGGPGTLVKLLSQIKIPTPPIVIVQHITATFAETLANRLDKITSFKLKLAKDGDFLQRNTAYLAPPDAHLEFEQVGRSVRIRLSDGPKVNFVKPAVDVTLFSAARLTGINPISVILTGMGSDGKEGSRIIKRVGGTVIALNREDSVVFGMNRSVIEANLADYVLPLDQIPGILRRLTHTES